MILVTFDDPEWVHAFLKILYARTKIYIQFLAGARYDILEPSGVSASSTVISPKLLEEFVALYDSVLIAVAHHAGQRIAYHTCGGMMPILEIVAAMEPDAIETFTPTGMGGDVDPGTAKVCMIGGLDQFHFLVNLAQSERARKCVSVSRRLVKAGGRFSPLGSLL